MVRYYGALKESLLFNGFDNNELDIALHRLKATLHCFRRNEIIRQPGTRVAEVGIVVDGFVYVSKIDYSGKRVILAEVVRGGTFGETLIFSGGEKSPIEIVAAKDCSVIFIPAESFVVMPEDSFDFRVFFNFMRLLAERNVITQMKNDILSQKTTREKLLLYFEYESRTAGSNDFMIHFTREELADFLCINVSAMSRELGKMRDEGILEFRKNRFFLKE